VVPCLVIFCGTAFWTFALPDIYRASTVILVEAQKVPDSYVRSTVSVPMQERLRTITQQIMSETRLEQVMRDLRLLSDLDLQNKRAVDRAIIKMRNAINIEVKGSDAFIISYTDKDPRTAMLVTNKLASLFIEENIKVREQRAVGTTEFLTQELQRVSTLLESQEKAVGNFKQRYMGELPQQLDVNQRALDRLQQQLQTSLETMEGARRRKSLLLQQLSLLPSSVTGVTSLTPDTAANALEQRLAQRREALMALQQLFTDEYPDVIRLKREIAELQAQLTVHRPTSPVPEREQSTEATPGSLRWQLQEEMHRIDLEVQQLQSQQENLRRDITAYERKIANVSQREQELHLLTRDYESTRQNYASLLERRMQAQISENLEKRQKAEQFKVLDSAGLPTQSWAPSRRKLLAMGLALGFAVGGGIAYLVEYLDRSFHDPEELKQFTALPVLATIPFVLTAAEQQRQQQRRRLLYAASVVIPMATIAAVHVFWVKIDLVFVRTWQLLKP
jgi:polysaccharide chain length determinant protein (PEP-CTERM system associated)